ncbi:MAG: leucine-rich repeat domain-containing protein [Clostridia bacterium]|nr:leucine-rich repeat domain-containing protein [Clostridia bacterium]
MSKMKKIAAMTAALLISASTMGYLPQNSIIISNVTANAAEEEITSVEINETNFPDAIFREYVKSSFDKDGDSVLSAEEIAAVTSIDVNSKGISDLTGIEYFTSLETLWCYDNKLTAIDVSNNTALTGLFCDFNQLTSIDVSKNTALFSFTCEGNQLTSLDLSNNPTLRSLYCGKNQLTSLDLSNNTNLGYLYCAENQLTSLDLSKNTALIELYCSENQLTSLDLSNNTALKELCCYANKLTAIDVSNNPKLTTLYCYKNKLTSLDLSNNTALEILKADDNKFEIALTDNTFDLSTLPAGFDVSKASEWTNGTVDENILTVDDTSKEVTYKYDCGNKIAIKFTLIPQIEGEITGIEINEANFPDAIFRKYVTNYFDTNEDMVLSDEEIADVTTIEVNSKGISDLTGIENFKKLSILYCSYNNLTTLDLSNNPELKTLYCYKNQLTSLDLSNNPKLKTLYCFNNQLTSLNVSKNTALINLGCTDNQLTSLDVSNSTALKFLNCSGNQLASLDVSNNTALTDLYTYSNKYEIALTDNTFDLSTLPTGFDVTKASEWTNATVKGNILTIEDTSKPITYIYDCGNGHSEVFTLVPPKTETPATTTTAPKTTATTTAMFTTTTFAPPSYSWYLSVYPYDKADTIYEIGEELDYSTICVHGYGGGENFHADIPYISLANCSSFVTVDASEFDNTKPGTYTIYVKWQDAVDSFDVTVVESDNAETPAATETTPATTATTPAATTTTAAPKTTDTTTTTTVPLTTAMFTTTTFPPPSYSCSLSVYPYDEADTIYEIGEELDYSTIRVQGHGTMTSFGSTSYIDIHYTSLDKCSSVTVDASEFDNTKPGTYTIYVKWHDAVDSFEVTVIDPDNPTAIPGVEINETNFPDPVFRQYLAENSDKNKDGRLSDKEIADVTDLTLGELGISDLTGIQYFKNLFSLWCYDNNLTTLDVSNNTELEILACGNNQLTSLDVSHNTLLTDLMCSNNQLASVDLSNTNCLEGWEFGVGLNNNKHRIKITDNTFDLSTLPTNFDVTKASDWTNGTVKGNILTIEDITKEVTYTYNCGLGFSETFALVPQIEETPAETTTTPAATETTITTTAITTTVPVTTTPATTTPEEDLPQTGFSNLYNCIPVSAGALVLLGMYAVKKSKKEDEEE